MEGQEEKAESAGEGVGGGGSGSLLWPQTASEDKSSSTDELQKSIRLATNVLDLSEGEGRCSGCCNYLKQDYGHPKIDLVNGTLKVMRLQRPNAVMNLTGNYFMSGFPKLSFKLKVLKPFLVVIFFKNLALGAFSSTKPQVYAV